MNQPTTSVRVTLPDNYDPFVDDPPAGWVPPPPEAFEEEITLSLDAVRQLERQLRRLAGQACDDGCKLTPHRSTHAECLNALAATARAGGQMHAYYAAADLVRSKLLGSR